MAAARWIPGRRLALTPVEPMNNSFSQAASGPRVARRHFLATAGALAVGCGLEATTGAAAAAEPTVRRNRIGVSTYSFWQFNRRDNRDIEKCIDLAAEMDFDGVELLHRQMQSEEKGYL